MENFCYQLYKIFAFLHFLHFALKKLSAIIVSKINGSDIICSGGQLNSKNSQFSKQFHLTVSSRKSHDKKTTDSQVSTSYKQ